MPPKTREDLLAEALKDFAGDHNCHRATASYHPAPDEWVTVEVQYANTFTPEPNDGWEVTVKRESL